MMPTINLNFPKPYNIFNKQIFDNLFDYSHFTEVWYGGASSGKSHGVVQKVVLKALKNWSTPRKVLWMRKVDRNIQESIFTDVIDCLSNWQILPLCRINKSNRTIHLPNGAVFLFKGLDDPEKIKSIKGLSDVVMEEASEFNHNDYTQLTLRLREPKHKQRQIFCMFNPVSKLNWTYTTWFDPTVKIDKSRVAIHQSTYKDNKFLDADNIKTIEDLKRTNPAYYKIYTLGEFATLDKLVFPSFETRRLNPRDPELINLHDYFGLDYGFVNDPSAFMHIKLDLKRRKLYVMDEFVKRGLLNNQLAKVIKDMGFAKEVITADSAEKKSIAEMRRDGIYRIRPALKGPDSIVQGIQFLQQFDWIIDDRCVKTIEELQNYTYVKDKKTDEYTNKPIDAYNHCIDATRYAVEEENGHGSTKATLLKSFM